MYDSVMMNHGYKTGESREKVRLFPARIEDYDTAGGRSAAHVAASDLLWLSSPLAKNNSVFDRRKSVH
jgi:hypothetical protein